MKFNVTEERRAELEPLVAQLRKWIEELEALDLDRYDPVLHAAPRESAHGDETPDN
jgi:hypothetical protein